VSDGDLPQRVIVIGTTGSGKSTLAKRLAGLLDARYIELDALHWEPNWIEATTEVFLARVTAEIAAPRWVVDGNYTGKLGFLTYDAADTVLWLDYAFPRVFRQLFVRTMGRRIRREELWNGNVERLRSHFFTKDSLFLWAVKSHWRHRRDYRVRFAQPEFAHLSVVRLRSPHETERYVAKLADIAVGRDASGAAVAGD
jgi:adenylate kinase family enzyme